MVYLREVVKLFIWVVIWIVIVDLILGYLFSYPEDDDTKRPSILTEYFNYGRSTEKKIRYMVGEEEGDAKPLAKAGWYIPRNEALTMDNDSKTVKATRVFVYGMSFSGHIGKELAKLDNNLDVRIFGGPGAPLNHSFSYYEQHRPHAAGDVVILGILAHSFPRINSITNMTISFEAPAPHFYPRYFIKDDNLSSISAPIHTLNELRDHLHSPEKWSKIKTILRENDAFFDPIVFNASWTDHSIVFRLLRRAWGQRQHNRVISKAHNNTGFLNHQGMIDVAKIILKKFASDAKADGVTPIVILFNNIGYSDHLHKALEKTLKQENMLFYSTHWNFSAENLSNFIPDGHFRQDIDQQIAKDILQMIRNNKARTPNQN